ncbi:MAG: hypothetical protein R2797_00530 [Gelidibacter sp.]
MPISDYNDSTFVAFTDISGFKELMKNDEDALAALKKFYQSGYDALSEITNIQGLFVSDAGVLFARDGSNEKKLADLLEVIKKINRKMVKKNYMLTTSIAYGFFNYQGKIEFDGIGKSPIYGGAYVQAFLDNENGKPKLQPGQCRICKDNLPDMDINELGLITEIGRNHYQYYWNLDSNEQIDSFEKVYNDSYSLKYSGMLKALKRNY